MLRRRGSGWGWRALRSGLLQPRCWRHSGSPLDRISSRTFGEEGLTGSVGARGRAKPLRSRECDAILKVIREARLEIDGEIQVRLDLSEELEVGSNTEDTMRHDDQLRLYVWESSRYKPRKIQSWEQFSTEQEERYTGNVPPKGSWYKVICPVSNVP